MSFQEANQLLVTSREAARLLSISERTLWELAKTRKVKRVKIGRSVRYHINDLEAWIEAQKEGSDAQ